MLLALIQLTDLVYVYTPASVTVRPFRIGQMPNGEIVDVGQEFAITSPCQYSPYWMTFTSSYPSDWTPLLEVFDVNLYDEILRSLTSAEVQTLLAQRPGPYSGGPTITHRRIARFFTQ